MDTTRATSRKASLASLRRKALPVTLSLLLCGALASTPAYAGAVGNTTTPTGGIVIGGTGDIVQKGANLVINQTSDKLVLNWQSFNLGQDASVLFNQPGTSSIALNRILDQSPSQIFGQISSNGQVFLINTHGIIFGTTAQVNVGGLVASTLDLTPSDFLSDHFNLNSVGGGAGIVNHGTIAAASGGSVSLIGGSVVNDGVILANYGRINLDGADHAVLDFDGNGLINVQITGALKQRLDAKAAVDNQGRLDADGGTVVLEASAARDLFTNLVNNSGVIDAGGISHDGGVVRLVARGGDTVNSGGIDATGAHGGSVQLLSDRHVGVMGGSIDASGTYGGGDIRVGGGWQGGEGLQTADAVYVADDATLKADATRQGDGGSVVVWGNQVNNFYGSISARGGESGGNGGRVETSSHDGLNAQGQVDASAPHGRMGTWLLDPYNVTISDADRKVSHNNNVYGASGNPSTVNASNVGSALTGGTSVYVFTGSSGSQNGDITVDAPISAAGKGQLYLQAAGSIYVNDSITAATGQALDVYLWANYAGSGGAGSYSKGACTTACLVSIGDGADAAIDTQGGLLDIQASGAVQIGKGTNVATIKAGTLDIGSAGSKVASVAEGTKGTVTAGTVNVVASKAITLANAANAINAASLSGGATTIVTSTSLALDTLATGDLTVGSGGTLSFTGGIVGGDLTATSTGDISQTGALKVTGNADFNAGAGAISLGQAQNDFVGTVSLAGGTTQVVDKNALVLGTLATGDLTATSHGNLTLGTGTVTGKLSAASNNGAITQAVGGLIVTGSSGIDAGTGAITLAETGNDFQGAVSLSGGTTQITDANALTLGTLATGALTATSHGTLNLGSGTIAGHLAASSNDGAIGQGGALAVDGTSAIDAGNNTITLLDAGNDFAGAVSLVNSGANNVALDNGSHALILGTSTVGSGTLSLSGNGISQVGALTQASGGGTVTLDAGTGALALDDSGNDFTGAVSAKGQGVALHSASDLSMATLDSGTDGSVSLTAGGALDLAALGPITTGAGDLTLGAGDSLSIGTALGGHNVSLTGGAGLTLAGDVTATGTLRLASTDADISQTGGSLAVTGASTIDAGTGNVSLNSIANTFGGAVSLTGHTVGITSAGTLALGALATGDLEAVSSGQLVLGTGSVSGNLVATSNGGAISQASGGLAVSGTSTLDAGGNTITLTDTQNDFGGAVSLTGGTVAIADQNALTLGTLATGALTASSTGALNLGSGTIGGPLTATSHGGPITQTGALAVTGASTIDAGSGDITLTDAGNDFGDVVSLTGGTARIADANALTLGTLATGDLAVTSNGALGLGHGSVSGDLVVTSHGGAISQAGALDVTGTGTLDAGAGSITLANAGNDFHDSLDLTGSGISMRDANDLDIAALANAANGPVSLVAGGALTLPATAIDTGTGNLVLAADGGALDTQGTLSGANVSLSGRDGVTLNHDVTAGGTLTLASAAGDIRQLGGVLTARTLAGTAGGSVSLGQLNAIGQLGSFSANGFSLANGGDLVIDGPVDGGAAGVSIHSAGRLDVAGDIGGDSIALQGAGGIGQSAGSIDAGTGQVSLTSGAGITQTGGSITADTLTGTAVGDVKLTGANELASLGSFSAASLALNDTAGMALDGPVTVTGDAVLSTGGNLAINDTLSAADISLAVDGNLTEGVAGNLVTGTLTGQATGNVTLAGNNHVDTLGSFSATNFALTNGQALTVNGNLGVGNGSIALTTTSGALTTNAALSGGNVALDSAADLVLGQAINGTTLSLESTGAISQTATGLITAGTLSGQSGGSTTLNQANAIAALGNFTAHGLILDSTRALTVSGTVDGGASTALASAGNLRIDGTLRGDATSLSAKGTLSEGALGNITATTLTGNATAATALDGANHIGTLGSFQAAGFSLHNAQDLRVAGTLDGGASTVLTTTGNLVLDGTVRGSSTRLDAAGALSETSHGRILAGTLAGHIAGSASLTGDNAVASLGNLDAAGLSFTNSQALVVDGTVNGGADATLKTTAGGLTINGTLAGTHTTLDIAGSIVQAAHGRIAAGTLAGHAGGDVTLDGDNRIATLGSFSAHDFLLSDGQALAVDGPLTASGGDVTLATTAGQLSVHTALSGNTIVLDSAGDLALGSTIHGGALSLQSGGRISQTAGGVITADSLSGHSAGSTTLDQANAIGELASFDAAGFSLTTRGALKITGAVDGGAEATLTTGGDLAIGGVLTADTTTLAVKGAIDEGSAGSIVAHSLTGHADGAASFTGANRIDTLDGFTAASFALTNGPSLTVAGPLDGGSSVSLTTTRGDLLVNGKISGKSTMLASSGAITEGKGGSIVADTLSGQAGGITQLGTATTPLANYIGTLGNFSSHAGFSLTNAQTLTLASVGGSAYTVDAGTSSLYLGVSGGDLLQTGKTWLYDGQGSFSSTGHIGMSDAPIYVTGTGPQAVAMVGLPPAYFYAVSANGNLLPLTGGSSVNVPTSLFTSRAQNANNHTDVYIDPSVISANYRSFGIVPSGILLPADQQACDPQMEECDE